MNICADNVVIDTNNNFIDASNDDIHNGIGTIGSIGKLCIPRIENTIQKEFIFKKICLLNIGYIQKLTEIPLKNNPNYKRILIKIKWNTSKKTTDLKNKLMAGQTIKLVYQMPWFWKICGEKTDIHS